MAIFQGNSEGGGRFCASSQAHPRHSCVPGGGALPGILSAALLVGPLLMSGTSWAVLLYHYRDLALVTLIAAAVLLGEGVAKAVIASAGQIRAAHRRA